MTERGSKVEAGEWVDKRDRQTRDVRWEQLDEDLVYSAAVGSRPGGSSGQTCLPC